MRTQGSAKELEFRRRTAGQLLLGGMKVSKVVELLGVSTSSVYRWKRIVEKSGLAGLSAKPHPGLAPRLSSDQKDDLKKILLGGAMTHGFPSDSWTCPRVAAVIEKTFGVNYHAAHVWKILTSLGFTCQKPERRARERDEKAIATWRYEHWPRIKKKLAESEK